MSKVYCGKCTHLLVVKKTNAMAFCVALCEWVGDQFVPRVDIKNVYDPALLNEHNDCRLYSIFPSWKSHEFKRWILQSIHDGKRGTATDIAYNSIEEDNNECEEEIIEEEKEDNNPNTADAIDDSGDNIENIKQEEESESHS